MHPVVRNSLGDFKETADFPLQFMFFFNKQKTCISRLEQFPRTPEVLSLKLCEVTIYFPAFFSPKQT